MFRCLSIRKSHALSAILQHDLIISGHFFHVADLVLTLPLFTFRIRLMEVGLIEQQWQRGGLPNLEPLVSGLPYYKAEERQRHQQYSNGEDKPAPSYGDIYHYGSGCAVDQVHARYIEL